MSLWRLIVREMLFRKAGLLAAMVCVTMAVACLVGAVLLLRGHEQRTEQLLAERERQTRQEMQAMEDDYRLIMRDLGYNVMILHADQCLTALRVQGHPDHTMPQQHAHDLGQGGIETLNHLLPVLQKQIHWPERDTAIILAGTPGQVPVAHRTQFLTGDGSAYRNPIRPRIAPGTVELGHALARQFELEVGDELTLHGERFTVARVHASQGDAEDVMLWCELDTAQRLLGLPGQINVIFALECTCPDTGVEAIQAEVTRLLPATQVLEFSSRVTARRLARQRAAEAHQAALAGEIEHRQAVAAERRALAMVLVPLVLAGSALWVFFLVLGNVRARQSEIGILRAVGVSEPRLVAVFLVKAMAIGAIGAVVGYGVGVTAAAWLGQGGGVDLALLGAALFVAVTLSALAALGPAMWAAAVDPASILRET